MGTTLAIASALSQTLSNNKALEAQSAANQKTYHNIMLSRNYSFQNLEQERQDAFESTIDALTQTKLQGNRQESSVRAAVNEGIVGGGRTANLITRATQADTNRATDSIKTNYQKQSNEIDLNKEAVLLNSKQQVSSIKNVEKPSIFSTLMNIGANYLGAKQSLESIGAIKSSAGLTGGGTLGNRTTSGASSYAMSSVDYDDLFGGTLDYSNKFKLSFVNPYQFTNSYTFSNNSIFGNKSYGFSGYF
ncbi:hypothetical protein [Pectinatus frisingensis]|uniref:virion core protein, T7 gp14 family n=1 Tax=Pectinatus frisingensis TaxID=865 RepID=UPI0018C4B4DC|nr:hypothetical protein [Pectinatus frisingensis]